MPIRFTDGPGGPAGRGLQGFGGVKSKPHRTMIPPPDDADDASFIVPITLSAQAVLNPDDSAPLNADALKNPLGVPIKVHELKWALYTNTGDPEVVNLISGLAVECVISVGVNPITNTSVPLYNLGSTLDPEAEIGGFVFPEDFTGQVFGVWKFDEPFYLEAGEGLQVQLKHRTLINQPITVTMAISGIPVCDIPKRRTLPFVSSFTATPILLDPTSTDLVRASNERDLVNPLSVPLRVRRMVGRLSVVSTPDADTVYVDPNTRHAVRDVLLNMTMRDSQGTPTVKDSTPFGAVFPVPTHSMEIPHVMPPGSYYIAKMTATVMAAADNIKAHPSIAIIGYRDIEGGGPTP